MVLPLIDRPRYRLCNDIYVRKIPSHGSLARQQTMSIVVLDEFDNCYKMEANDWCSGHNHLEMLREL